MKILLILNMLLLLNSVLFGQDTLFTKKGKTISCKITEIRTDEITYKDFDNLDGPNIIIPISSIKEIHYQNGKVANMTSEEVSVKKKVDIINKNQCIKFNILGPLFDNFGVNYERKLNMRQNLDIRVGYIGIDDNISNLLGNNYTKGFYVSGGVKFIMGQKSQDYYIDEIKYLHPMQGRYIKPEFIFATIDYSYDYFYYVNSTVHLKKNLYGLIMNFGKQYMFSKSITFDPYIGFGYGIVSSKIISGKEDENYIQTEFNYGGCIMLTEEFPLIITGGFTLGYCFK